MTTLDKNLERNRNHYLIYNKLDDCCFSRPWSEIMERAGKEINYKNFIIKELDVNKHTIDLDFLLVNFNLNLTNRSKPSIRYEILIICFTFNFFKNFFI